MSKVKLILFAVAFIILSGLITTIYIQQNQLEKLEIENARIDFNNFQLMQDNQEQTVLYLKEKEVTGNLRLKIDSLAESLRVKPKQIDRIIYRTITQKEIDTVPVFVSQFANHKWNVIDTGYCFVWKGVALLSDDSLSVQRTDFFYQNKITEVYYRKRSKQFLFFKYGKWKNFRQDSAQCGGVVTKEFNFIK